MCLNALHNVRVPPSPSIASVHVIDALLIDVSFLLMYQAVVMLLAAKIERNQRYVYLEHPAQGLESLLVNDFIFLFHFG